MGIPEAPPQAAEEQTFPGLPPCSPPQMPALTLREEAEALQTSVMGEAAALRRESPTSPTPVSTIRVRGLDESTRG